LRRDRLAIAAAGLCLAAALFPVAAVAQDEPYDGRPYLEGGALRLQVTPKDAAVYVDGFYAGIVDDFNSAFQRLPVPPGEHGSCCILRLSNRAPADQRRERPTGAPRDGKAGPRREAEPPPVAPPRRRRRNRRRRSNGRGRKAGSAGADAAGRGLRDAGDPRSRPTPRLDRRERWSGSNGSVALRVEVARAGTASRFRKTGSGDSPPRSTSAAAKPPGQRQPVLGA
jgi:hypothetical protein